VSLRRLARPGFDSAGCSSAAESSGSGSSCCRRRFATSRQRTPRAREPGSPIRYLVRNLVESYIGKHELYGQSPSANRRETTETSEQNR